jgi:uncharacterized protein
LLSCRGVRIVQDESAVGILQTPGTTHEAVHSSIKEVRMSARHKAIIEDVNDAFRRGDTEAFLAHCTDDVVWSMVGDRPITGKAAIRTWMQSMPGQPPTFTVRVVAADGDYVFAQGEMSMAENGRPVPYAFCDVYRFSGDRIAELKAFVIKTEPAELTRSAGSPL